MLACSVWGAYLIVAAISYFSGGVLQYILLNIIHRASIPGYSEAIIVVPMNPVGRLYLIIYLVCFSFFLSWILPFLFCHFFFCHSFFSVFLFTFFLFLTALKKKSSFLLHTFLWHSSFFLLYFSLFVHFFVFLTVLSCCFFRPFFFLLFSISYFFLFLSCFYIFLCHICIHVFLFSFHLFCIVDLSFSHSFFPRCLICPLISPSFHPAWSCILSY